MQSLSRAAMQAVVGAAIFASSGVSAQCIDVVDVRTELPHDVVTSQGARISYFYNLESEQYLVLWYRGEQAGQPYGPFMLTRGCAPATLRWESEQFLLLEAGCGTFCWGVEVLPLTADGAEEFRIFRPLAFDSARNLLAFYADLDVIRVRNLVTGREQDIRTVYECETPSGLCFQDPNFVGGQFQYRWRYDPTGEVHSAPLEDYLTLE